jgi:hypothetical protein
MDNNQKTNDLIKGQINISEANELRDWSDKLNVTKVKLKAAINAVGPMVKDVEAYLNRKKA